MKVFLILLIFTPFMIFSQLPESQLSKQVIKKQYPLLEKAFKEKDLLFGNPIFIRIFKEDNELEIWVKKDKKYSLFKTYTVCYFSGGLGPKKKKGDGKSPEGFYSVKSKQLNPYSTYHLSFDTGYPNDFDRSNAYTGSGLMVHGNCVSIGCYAMTDERIEEIYSILQKSFEKGQESIRLNIFPFRMTDIALASHKNSEYYDFWKNLKEGYDYFETQKIPPAVTVKNKKYLIEK